MARAPGTSTPLVDAGNAAGLQFIARLERPPDWARAQGTAETAPPQNLDDYGDFVAAFVQHFKGRVHYVQIWNEPNRFEDWGFQPVDPVAYTKLLQVAYARAKQVDPSIVVLSAALTPTTDCCTKNRPDPVYLQQMYEAGAGSSFDVLGAQAYGLRAGPEDPWQDLPWRPNESPQSDYRQPQHQLRSRGAGSAGDGPQRRRRQIGMGLRVRLECAALRLDRRRFALGQRKPRPASQLHRQATSAPNASGLGSAS